MTPPERMARVRAVLSAEPRPLREIANLSGVDLYDTETAIIGLCQSHAAIRSNDYAYARGPAHYLLKAPS